MSGKFKVPNDKRSLDYVAELPNRHKRRANILPQLYTSGVIDS
jgi:hypothetical protein